MSTDGDDDITSIDMYFFGIAKLCFNKVCGCKKMLSEKKRELAGESREFAGIDGRSVVACLFVLNASDQSVVACPHPARRTTDSGGGRLKAFSRDINFYSTYWTAVDWGLIARPSISGKTAVKAGEKNVQLSVPLSAGARYRWHLPKGCKIKGDKQSNTISVNWGDKPGNVDVTETGSGKCKLRYSTLRVVVELVLIGLNK